MFAEVAFPISNFQSFTYVIPKELKKEIQLGSRVLAPFGKRNCQGIILSIKKTTSFSGKIKSIHSLVDDIPVVTPEINMLDEQILYDPNRSSRKNSFTEKFIYTL